MPKRKNKTRTLNKDYKVRISHAKVFANSLVTSIFAILAFTGGLFLIHQGRPTMGILVIVFMSVIPIIFAWIWNNDAGKVVVEIENDGLTYNNRKILWAEIKNAKIEYRSRAPDRLRIMLRNGKRINIIDDMFDSSIEQLENMVKTHIQIDG